MGLKEQALSKVSPLYDFANHLVEVNGLITLPIILGDDEHTTIEYFQFYVVNHPITYNAIFGKPIMKMAMMVVTTFYMKTKFQQRLESISYDLISAQ